MRDSFEAIHREFQPKVLRYLSGIVDPQEAEDLAQVTMIKVSASLAGFRGDSSLSTWIYRIATNVALDRLRRQAPASEPIDAEDEEGEAGEEVPAQLQSPAAEAVAIRTEMSECLREFVHRLPPAYAAVLILSEIQGFSDREIAAMTRCSVESVKIRLHRARLKLREALRDGCSIGSDEGGGLACEARAPAHPH